MTFTRRAPHAEAPLRERPSAPRRWVLGDQPWGRLETRVLDRSGSIVQHVLIVYPPGTNDRERAALWWNRTWPWAGAVVGIGALMLLGDLVPRGALLAAVGLSYLAGVAVGLRLTRRLRPRVRRVYATTPRDARPWDADGRLELIGRTVRAFADLDGRRTAGLIDPVRYESAWARLHAALDTDTAMRRSR